MSTIAHCQNSTGGFGGGPSQLAHLATTYAAVNALAIIGTKEAYDVVDRYVFVIKGHTRILESSLTRMPTNSASLLSFFLRLKQPDGSFLMHVGGEADAR